MTEPSDEGVTYSGPPPTAPPAGYGPGGYGPPPGGPGYPFPGYGYGYGYGYPAPGYPGSAYPGYGYAGYGYAGYGYAGYGYPYAPPRAAGPRRPGQLLAAAVLAFVQAALTLVATFYVFVLASFAGVAAGEAGTGIPADLAGLATEARVLSAVQLGGAVLLVVGGVLALSRRAPISWRLLVGALGLQIALAGYWIVRLGVLSTDIPGDDPTPVFVVLGIFFALLPVTALVLACVGPSRRWLGPAGSGA